MVSVNHFAEDNRHSLRMGYNVDTINKDLLTSGILVLQRLEIGVENLKKKWNIE